MHGATRSIPAALLQSDRFAGRIRIDGRGNTTVRVYSAALS